MGEGATTRYRGPVFGGRPALLRDTANVHGQGGNADISSFNELRKGGAAPCGRRHAANNVACKLGQATRKQFDPTQRGASVPTEGKAMLKTFLSSFFSLEACSTSSFAREAESSSGRKIVTQSQS